MARITATALLILTLAAPASAQGLQIFFIDAEGGSSTLIVTPTGESLLIDTGSGRPSPDHDRVMAAIRHAGIERIDYLLLTHFHGDHVGGVFELASRIPIGTFVDYGSPLGTPYGPDRGSVRYFSGYEAIRRQGRHFQPHTGERLPLGGIELDVVSSGGVVLTTPLAGAGEVNDACATLNDHPEDGTENFRSLGVVLRYGDFSLVNLGDLSGNTLSRLICPRNLLGEASAYLIAHHGNYDTDSEAIYAALKPRVAIMNNGARKGGDPVTVRTVQAQPDIDLWQLHWSRRSNARNAAEDFVANLDEDSADGYWIKLTASEDGSFTVTNGRTGFSRMYLPESSSDSR